MAELRTLWTLRPASPRLNEDVGVERGFYVWIGEDFDPHLQEHIDLLAYHPGFDADVKELRELVSRDSQPGRISVLAERSREVVAAAGRWRISPFYLQQFVLSGDNDVRLPMDGDKVFVEDLPYEYVIHVPKHVTPGHREAIQGWFSEQRSWLGPQELAAHKKKKPKASLSPAVISDLPLYERWLHGETVEQLAAEDNRGVDQLASALRKVSAKLKAISPRGLPENTPSDKNKPRFKSRSDEKLD